MLNFDNENDLFNFRVCCLSGLSSAIRVLPEGTITTPNHTSSGSPIPIASSHSSGPLGILGGSTPIPTSTLSTSSSHHHYHSRSSLPQPEHCLETLLRNIEGLLAIAAHNARQQQSQLNQQKGKLNIHLFSSN